MTSSQWSANIMVSK